MDDKSRARKFPEYEQKAFYKGIEESLILFTKFCAEICESAVSLFNIFDREYQYTVSTFGVWEKDIMQRDESYCNITLGAGKLIELNNIAESKDAQSVKLANGTLVKFYVGVPLKNSTGKYFATLCAMDSESHSLSQKSKEWLQLLGRQLEVVLQLYSENKKYKEIENELEDKNILFSEIHHRIKNNLADICATLQMEKAVSDDATFIESLSRAESRITVAIKLHELLYESLKADSVNIREYVEKLVNRIREISERKGKKITIHTEIDDFQIDFNQCLPLGLILNELLTNSFKHAFKNKIHGIISIEIHESDDDEIWLNIADNGSGIDLEHVSLSSYGLKLIELLSKQLEGTFSFENRDGSVFDMHFRNRISRMKDGKTKRVFSH